LDTRKNPAICSYLCGVLIARTAEKSALSLEAVTVIVYTKDKNENKILCTKFIGEVEEFVTRAYPFSSR
jgi:hypothetical protein